MLAKKKLCTGGCQEMRIIWKNHDGLRYCKICWLKQTPYKDKPAKPKIITPIKNVSKKRLHLMTIYRIRRDAYFKLVQSCEYPGCTCTELDLHHKKGRTGILLIDIVYFCALCRPHHQWVEDHPEQAIEMGLSVKRLNNNDP